MNVLSLFDGMSCGQLALQRAGIFYDKYYASEIDKYAIKVSKHHFPSMIHLGSVVDVKGTDFDKIDLLIGGSPCQGFSVAGKQLNFQDQRSKLFFEYVRILKDIRVNNPDVFFLLENVKMKKDYELHINKLLGVRPIRLNSALVSAQNRERLYWTNIPVIDIPKDRKIFLKDIIEDGEVDRAKSYCIDANYFKGGNEKSYFEKGRRKLVSQSARRNMVMQINEEKEFGNQPRQQNRVYHIEGKSPALLGQMSGGTHSILQKGRGYNKGGEKTGKVPSVTSNSWEHNNHLLSDGKKRKLTVKECCRLQTVPDDYFDGIVSNTQAYKMLGNGWTIDIIVHLIKALKQMDNY